MVSNDMAVANVAPQLKLKDLLPLWERKLTYLMNEAVFERFLRRDVDILGPPSIQEIVGERGALAQDAFCTLIVRQGGVHRTL